METHSSISAWENPWIEGPGRLQSMGLQRGGHQLVTKPRPLRFQSTIMQPYCCIWKIVDRQLIPKESPPASCSDMGWK